MKNETDTQPSTAHTPTPLDTGIQEPMIAKDKRNTQPGAIICSPDGQWSAQYEELSVYDIERAIGFREVLVDKAMMLADLAEELQKNPTSKNARLTILNAIDNMRGAITQATGGLQ